MKYCCSTQSWYFLDNASFNGRPLNNIDRLNIYNFWESGLLYIQGTKLEDNYYLVLKQENTEKPYNYDVYELTSELEILIYKKRYEVYR